MHASFMNEVTDARVAAVITGLWSSFELRDIAAQLGFGLSSSGTTSNGD
jgi:hypothetical protein